MASRGGGGYHGRADRLASATTASADMAEEQLDSLRAWRCRTRNEVLAFSLPALSTVLADPIMSVVDAAVVSCGRRPSQLQCSSLNVAVHSVKTMTYTWV